MEPNEINLEKLYNDGLDAMRRAENTPRGDSRQDLYLIARRLFERSETLIQSLELFSSNEIIDDIATNNLKYLLIPAYLAKIATSSECAPNRVETFTRAENHIKSFINNLTNYGLASEESIRLLERQETTAVSSDPTTRRNETIEKYKKMKLLQDELDHLEGCIQSKQDVDHEVLRDYYLKLINKWKNDTLDSWEREVKPALFFERNRNSLPKRSIESATNIQGKTFKPYTIAKDALQKQVFGLGYPSHPTVTVDEFITKKINDGDLSFHAQKEVYANSLQRYAEQPSLMRDQEESEQTARENLEEKEDELELIRQRNWDQFKDDNPRGSGNRRNMG